MRYSDFRVGIFYFASPFTCSEFSFNVLNRCPQLNDITAAVLHAFLLHCFEGYQSK